ncbi:hypothetical protein HMPREF2956_02040 [Staphylococcus sp. HMSC055B03]|uniref:hypothetical protein n=1 Tax=Staphylococcus TaxID=1279 RepID=UPI00066C1F2D|nr:MULTISPECIES: hypothetical protein [Staphylococcus]OFS35719.1 hypothetical protein HMPREF2956_02040 [Staphylococcus sp. HMSC055B03]
MATNKDVFKAFLEDKNSILNRVDDYIDELLENNFEVDDSKIQYELSELKSTSETMKSSISRDFSDETGDVSGEKEVEELDDKIYDCQQIEIEDETSIKAFEVALSDVSSKANDSFDTDNDVYKTIQSKKDDVYNSIAKIEKEMRRIEQKFDESNNLIKSARLSVEIEELNDNLTYNPISPIAPAYVEPVKNGLNKLQEEIENGSEPIEIQSQLNRVNQDIKFFEAWFDEWEKIIKNKEGLSQ